MTPRGTSVRVIGVISDTHGLLRPDVHTALAGVDLILHAGDVGGDEILMELGLIDEYYFVVHPLIAAQGKRLMEGIALPEHIQLKLVDCKVFKSGALGLHYVKA